MTVEQAKKEYKEARLVEDKIEWDLIGTAINEAVRGGRKSATLNQAISPHNVCRLKEEGYEVRTSFGATGMDHLSTRVETVITGW